MIKKEIEKINFIGLISIIIFNLIFGIAIGVTVLGLIIGLWTINITFIISPFIFIGVVITKIQSFTWLLALTSITLSIVGIAAYPFVKRYSLAIIKLTKRYFEYNKKVIYN